MSFRSRVSGAVERTRRAPPWYVRLVGAALIVADGYVWLGVDSPTSPMEFAKHGLWLAIGLACFYPEGLGQVVKAARQLPFLDRRAVRRPRKPSHWEDP